MLAVSQVAAGAFLTQTEELAEGINSRIGEWIKERPALLFMAAVISVSGCCYFS